MNMFSRFTRITVEDRDPYGSEAQALRMLSDKTEPSFRQAMDDDFNTAAAIGHLFTALGTLNGVLDEADSEKRGVAIQCKEEVEGFFRKTGQVLGFFEKGFPEGEAWFASGAVDEDAKVKAGTLAEERVEARKNRDWTKADQLRDAIAELGYDVQDTPQGPVLITKK
jgi:cysteinyl-tRNA synthetase